MLDSFIRYTEENSLCQKDQQLLLAVSGGIDSVTMTSLYQEAGYRFSLAHCNFQLRGDESEGDQQFVEELAARYACKLYIRRFDTLGYSREKGISIQMAARELRYSWFSEIAAEKGFDHVAVAHNRNDVAETMLLNLIRGTGLKGLTGIKPSTGIIIRPLLFASRTAIEDYAKSRAMKYREDSSNSENKYQRNLIRRELIPLMQRINPSVVDSLIKEAEIFSSTYQVYERSLKQIHETVVERDKEAIKLSISKIISLRLTDIILFDLLSPYGFSFTEAKNILATIHAEPGRRFFSREYVLVKDRNYLILEKVKASNKHEEYYIDETASAIDHPVHLLISRRKNDELQSFPKHRKSVALDADCMQFPLKIRHWKKGDAFYPLGMKGRKKLSDYFTDQKINVLEKEKVWLLVSGEEIAWVIGWQISEHFKIRAATRNSITFTLNE